eukprot:CAMPEP_0197672004 /NCGR_PEP_ID=MMETSP1338-20131121/77923_1 /TAXON_ID=43686 ORGANISM="Pelagodinium beii, Strain RCC1491" /NCGR_SAMPLE_ID=MMETSP1338 /ASSEMBLY_ACC=CAM_ASM_000754 /LENGTH=87 /DNA_ID=CAMNT_0043252013 /DNA_START=291 /DNA_END=551 /DNA_ORIENTATION=+
MRKKFPDTEEKRCCEESNQGTCMICCTKHFKDDEECTQVCQKMCSSGWTGTDQQGPQCPELVGTERGGGEEWYAEDPMKDRPHTATE